MLPTVTRPHDLAARIRRAREDAGWTQTELGRRLTPPVHYRTVQGWEAGRVPRNAVPDLERVLGVDLTTPPGSTSPRLDEATDAQLVAELSGRLADAQRQVRDLTVTLAETRDADVLGPGQRWAAREDRDPPSQ